MRTPIAKTHCIELVSFNRVAYLRILCGRQKGTVASVVKTNKFADTPAEDRCRMCDRIFKEGGNIWV